MRPCRLCVGRKLSAAAMLGTWTVVVQLEKKAFSHCAAGKAPGRDGRKLIKVRVKKWNPYDKL